MQGSTANVGPQIYEYQPGGSQSQVHRGSSVGIRESAFAAPGAFGHSDARFDGRQSNGSIAQYGPAISSHRVSAGGSSKGRVSVGGAHPPSHFYYAAPGMTARVQSTGGLQGMASDQASDQASASDGFTNGWITTDARILTTAAPDLKGRLDNALDNLAVSGAPFLNRFVMLSAAHRRVGGQGVVQVRRHTVPPPRPPPSCSAELHRLTRCIARWVKVHFEASHPVST